MQSGKPKSIRIVGIVIVMMSVFVVLSNALGLLLSWFFADRDSIVASTHFRSVAVIYLLYGVAFLAGGINLIRFRRWARVLLMVMAVLLVIGLWLIVAFPVVETAPSSLRFVMSALWTVPSILLIIYLNQRIIKGSFE